MFMRQNEKGRPGGAFGAGKRKLRKKSINVENN
jgi:hypothetical protein